MRSKNGSIVSPVTRLRAIYVILTALVCAACGRAAVNDSASAAEMPVTYTARASLMSVPAIPQEPAPAPPAALALATGAEGATGVVVPARAATSGNGASNQTTGPEAAEPDAPQGDAPSPPKPPKSPLLIYKADVVLAVFETNKGLDAVEKLAREAHGYLVSRRQDSIVIRVPAAGFDGSLQTILKLGDVLQRNLQVEDVTAQMNDLTTRLKNAEAVRSRLEQLLNMAKSTDEALKVEQQLGRVTLEIESIKGKIRLMSELIAFSTITVTFRPVAVEQVNTKFKLPFPWLDELGLSSLMNL